MAHTHNATHAAPEREREGHHGHISMGTYYAVFGGLMGLMILTVAAWWLEKNVFALPEIVAVGIAMAIAIAKTALIIIFFMHVKVSSKITKVFAATAFVWLLILFGITMGDYLSRGWPPQIGPLP